MNFEPVKVIESTFIYCMFLVILLLPLIGVFIFVWVLTLNWIAATILSVLAQVLYIKYFW